MPDSPDFYSEFWGALERRIHREWFAITLFTLSLSIVLSLNSERTWLAGFDRTFYDSVLRAKPVATPDDEIVIIAIDDSSIQALGPWPWRRSMHAQLLDYLVDARSVGFDIVFSESHPDFPEDDHTLAQAIARHGRVILPTVIDARGADLFRPVPRMAQAAAGIGYINVYPDTDGTVRALTLKRQLEDGSEVQHFIVSLAGESIARDPPPDQRLLIPYTGRTGGFSFYPYAAVLRGEVPPDSFRNRIVLVGAWASGMGDNYPTPMTQEGESMSGVEIMANGLLALQNDSWIRTLSPWTAALLAALPILAACLGLRRFSPRHAFIATLAIVVLWPSISAAMLVTMNVWIPFSATLITIALAFILWTWRSQEASMQHIDRELQTLRKIAAGDMEENRMNSPYDRSLPARVRLLHQSVVRFRQAQQKREETLRFLSHDMRAPQNAILALIEMQSREIRRADSELLERIRQRATDTLELMDGFAHLEHAEVTELKLCATELCDLLREACDACWELASRRNIDVAPVQLPDEAWVKGDRARLKRVLQNLLDNAIKYSPDGTEVRCGITRESDYFLIEVADQGRGIPPDQLEAVFDSFTRLESDRPGNANGAGLGLAFVRTTIQRHGGTVFARSEQGHGSSFFIKLPMMDD